MPTSKVSILIPLYNSSQFVDETIEDCLNQTYENIEIIIVDDGSTDGSLSKALKWSNQCDKIKVYQISNSGACHARNLAFEKSTGEYIMYLDADDKLSPNKISAQMELLKNEDINSISTCKWKRFFANGHQFNSEPTICARN